MQGKLCSCHNAQLVYLGQKDLRESTLHLPIFMPLSDCTLVYFFPIAIPSLSELDLLKWADSEGNSQTFSIVGKISSDWRRIGLRIGIENNVLDGWEKRHSDSYQLCIDVFGHWLNGGGETYTTSWAGLSELLKDMGYSQIVTELQIVLNTKSPQS